MTTDLSRSDPLAILRNGRHHEADFISGTGYRMARVLRRIECADGFNLSVQAGEYLYSNPREDRGPWSHVEVGYPSERPEPWDDWKPYAEEPDRPDGTVYSYVPFSMVEALIESHGGPA